MPKARVIGGIAPAPKGRVFYTTRGLGVTIGARGVAFEINKLLKARPKP